MSHIAAPEYARHAGCSIGPSAGARHADGTERPAGAASGDAAFPAGAIGISQQCQRGVIWRKVAGPFVSMRGAQRHGS